MANPFYRQRSRFKKPDGFGYMQRAASGGSVGKGTLTTENPAVNKIQDQPRGGVKQRQQNVRARRRRSTGSALQCSSGIYEVFTHISQERLGSA